MRCTLVSILARTYSPVLSSLSPEVPSSTLNIGSNLTDKNTLPLVATVGLCQNLTPNNAGASNVGAGDGSQFITGGCVSDADCSSACCAEIEDTATGICSAEAASLQNGKQGCGFEDPNADATIAAAQKQVEEQGF